MQVFDVLKGIDQCHQQGYVTGSIDPTNILFNWTTCPKGFLHAPGLVEVDTEKNHKWARFPYYNESKSTISIEDEVIAAAVLLVECMWADLPQMRETWREYLYCPQTFDGKPRNLLRRHLDRLLSDECASPELLKELQNIEKGKIKSLTPVIKALED